MADVTTSKDSEYFYISITSSKNIINLKYNDGVRDSFFFNNNGINIEVNKKTDRNFKIKLNEMRDDKYSLIIYFEDRSYEIHYFTLSFIDNIKKYNNATTIIFTDYAPFNKNKLITSMTKFSFIFSPTKDDINIKDLFNLGSHIEQKDIFKYITNVSKITDLTADNNKISLKLNSNNVPQEYLYGAIILNSSSKPIAIVKTLNETLIDTNDISFIVTFSII